MGSLNKTPSTASDKFKILVKNLPYDLFIEVKEYIKMTVGTRPWPEHAPSVVIEETPQAFESQLREWHYEGLYLSYNYEGQLVDMRRPEGVSKDDKQLELHIRARNNPDGPGLEVVAHLELSRYEHKQGHIREEMFVWLDEDDLEHVIAGGDLNPQGGVVTEGWG